MNYHRFGILRNDIDSKLYNIEERERIEELDGEVKRREIYGFEKSLVPFQKEKKKKEKKGPWPIKGKDSISVTQEHFNSKPFCHMAGKRHTTSLVLN